MGFLDRFRRPSAEDIAAEVMKGLGNTPLAQSGGTVVTQPGYGENSGLGGSGLLQSPGFPSQQLPRDAGHFGAQLGPAQPFIPALLDAPDPDTGRALPRLWEFPVAWNLNLTDRATPWTILRSLAEQCDVVARCIEIRTAEIVGLEWDITISDHAVSEIMNRENVGHAKAFQIARDENSAEIDMLKAFWENPYPSDRPWQSWITEVCWQHFVYDAIAIYPRLNLGGKVIGFEIVDASTIKPLLDNRGAIPEPPAPAFQQILWGFPRGEYQHSPNVDGEFYTGDTPSGEFAKDQLAYFVRNRRTWSPYGVSSVERSIPAATLYLERQNWMKTEYTEGSVPQMFMKSDSDELDAIKLASLERILNDQMSGQTGERHRIKLLPKGLEPHEISQIDSRYSADYDEFIIKQIGSKFGVTPTQLGVIPHTGLGGKGQMEGEQDQAETMSKRPTEQFLIGMINSLNRRFLGASRAVTFTLSDPGTTGQQAQKATAAQISLYSGQQTLNDARSDLGLPLYEMPEADEPFIVAGNQVTFLKGLMATDSGGETTVQQGTDAQASTDATTAPEAPQIAPKPSEATTAPTASADEIKAFKAFVLKRAKTGRWRDFDFQTLDPEVAKALNAQGMAEVVKAPKGEARTTYRAHNI